MASKIGQLIRDFHQADSKNIHYDVLAHGVKYYKEDKKERENMCEAVEKYAREYAKDYAEEYVEEHAKDYSIRERVCSIKLLMKNLQLTLDQALSTLEIQGAERKLIIDQLQK